MNKTDFVKEHWEIGLQPLMNISSDIIQISMNKVLMINTARKNIYQQCENNKHRHFISADVLVVVSVQCYCWIYNDDVVSPIYKGCIDEIETCIYDPSQNLIYIALLLNSNNYINYSKMEILQKLNLPRPINDYSLNNEEVLDLKHVISAQKNKYSNSINNRLNNHEFAISNIYIFKLFVMFVPPLCIILVNIICFIFKTKK